MKNPRWPIRSARPTDRNYIIKSWVMALRSQFPYSELSPRSVDKLAARIEALVGVASVDVVCDPENDDVVYGFMCYETGILLGEETPTLHFIWVRKKLRGYGIANQLFYSKFGNTEFHIYYTHITKFLKKYSLFRKWRLQSYDPYLIEGALFREARQIDAKTICRKEIPCQVSAAT